MDRITIYAFLPGKMPVFGFGRAWTEFVDSEEEYPGSISTLGSVDIRFTVPVTVHNYWKKLSKIYTVYKMN